MRAEAHLRIGRLLAAHTPAEKREEAIFEIVNQLNRGAALITSRDEREQLAELNLLAGQRAKATTAYASALTYLTAGAALLPENCWERRHELTFALELHRAECEFLTGALAEAEQRLAALSSPRRKYGGTSYGRVLARGSVHDPRSEQPRHCRRSRLPPASGHRLVAASDGRGSATRIRADLVAAREPHDRGALIELPLMSDPASLATMDVLTKIGAACILYGCEPACPGHLPSGQSQPRARQLRRLRASPMYGLACIAGPRFGDYQAGISIRSARL